MSLHPTAEHVRRAMLDGLAIAKRTYPNVPAIQVGHRDSIVLLTDADGSFLWSASVPELLTMDGSPGAVCRSVAEYACRKLGLNIAV